MKTRSIYILLLGMVLLPIYFGSCAQDRWALYAEETKSDRWIDDTMRVWYYWNQSIPNTNDLNYFQEPFTFFSSLLSDEDGKNGTPYSTIDSLTPATRSIPYTDYSYGFQFTTNRVEGNDTALYAHVLYVVPESPAGEIGLQRGDWIMEMDGEPITEDNYGRLYGDGSMQLTIGYYDAENDTIRSYNDGPQTIASARSIQDIRDWQKELLRLHPVQIVVGNKHIRCCILSVVQGIAHKARQIPDSSDKARAVHIAGGKKHDIMRSKVMALYEVHCSQCQGQGNERLVHGLLQGMRGKS